MLHFPSHSSQVHIECKVSIPLRDSDKYAFPARSELVSAVYDISASQPFPVPVIVQVQHCIPLLNNDEASQLGMSFMMAHKRRGPPYVFRELDGGCFKCDSHYGEIHLTHFCSIGIAIKWWLGRPIPFFGCVFYTQDDRATFVVTQNLAAHITVSSASYTAIHGKYC